MSRIFVSAAVAAILGACAATTPITVSAATPHSQPTATTPTTNAVSCEIRATHTVNGLRLEPVASSARGFDGEYEFTLAKSGAAGSSDVSQGGPVSIEAGRHVTLAASEISVGRNGRVRATLVVRNVAGEICRSDYRS